MKIIVRRFLLLLILSFLCSTITYFIKIVKETDDTSLLLSYMVKSNKGPDDKGLTDLNSIAWPEYKRPNATSYEMVEKVVPFGVRISTGQYASLKQLITKFEEVMVSMSLQDQWFLGSGTLLGSLQHHDMIPWDDDCDVSTALRYRPLIQSALRNLAPEFGTYSQKARDKLYFRPFTKTEVDPNAVGSHPLSNYPWAWPFIDISYYQELNSFTAEEYCSSFHKFNLSDVFPLTYRPFGKHWFPAPRRPINYLKSYYAIEKPFCSSHGYSHALEKDISPHYMECRRLLENYAFVHRCPVPLSEGKEDAIFYSDEYLVNSKGQSIHKIRTILDQDEIHLPFFTVKHELFRCPD